MRLIHTSDWHLGRSFHRVGLLDAQAHYMDHLVEVVRSERVEAVLVSGDIYDRALPSPDTVTLLSDAVTRLIDAGAVVVLSSGNHDSAIRLGFASDLLARAGLHIRTSVDSIGVPVMFKDTAIHPLPYLEPSVVADVLGARERTHSGVLKAAMDRVRAHGRSKPGPSVVMAHAFVSGAATSESERDISVGGVSAVHPEVFTGASYVALGHLHGPQRIRENVRYSGSPIALSFSEAAHHKGSLLVDLSAGSLSTESIPAPVDTPLAILRGDLEDLLLNRRHRGAESAFCQVTLTDAVRPMGAMERLRERFPKTLVLQFEPSGVISIQRAPSAATIRAKGDLDLCCDFLSYVREGNAPTDHERDLMATATEAAARVDHDQKDRKDQDDHRDQDDQQEHMNQKDAVAVRSSDVQRGAA